tara:strand:- start:1205 stop:2980 length:1776 start_codon:yes stop_codon:yes gene_type:complete
MCGFLGKIAFTDFDSKELEKPNSQIICRGPDNTKKFELLKENLKASLIFNRLSILDLAENANQPMHSENSKSILMFNGEIYNHKELRKYLSTKGCNFKTSHSDTEVVLNGLEIEGIEFINKLRGQFSIFYLNQAERKFYLIRDRLGQKPLYFYNNNDLFIFGSNLSAVKQLTNNASLAQDQINNYLKYGVVGGSKTIYENIYKVLPAEAIEINFSNDNFTMNNKKYWDINEKVNNLKFDKEEFFSILSESIEMRLIADVPVANFLSGGLDSSTIVKNMYENDNEINTFTVSTESKKYDESLWANKVSEKYNTNHKVSYVSSDLNIQLANEAIESLDEPYSDPSVIPSFLISNEISKHYKVAISGDGGDELLGGYERTEKSLKNINTFHNMFSKLYKIYPSFLGTGANFLSKSNELSIRYRSFLEDENLLKLLKINLDNTDDYISLNKNIDSYKSLLVADYNFFLPDMMLFKIDRTSMANSLEVRSPFVDHKLIEYILSRSTEYRNSNIKKSLLKNYLIEDFDSNFINRKKQGFVFDLESWIFNNFDYFYDYLVNSRVSRIVDLNSLKMLKLNKSRINSNRIWKLYVLNKFI